MKAIALGLLAAAGLVYVVASTLTSAHPAWGYVAAFAEAAMVGAIADWFAVVALFLPLAFVGRTMALYPRLALQAGSVAIGAVACIWLLERAFDLSLLA